MISYYSGLPYSDELFHHGIKNQKWGIRRYQNEDGSLTTLGRIHYGVGKATEKTGKALKSAGQAMSKVYKKKHPSSMTDEELKKAIDRINLETQYKQAMEKNRPQASRARRVAEDILEASTKSLASGLVSRWNQRMMNLLELDNMENKFELEDRRTVDREKRQEQRDAAREARQEARDILRESRQEKRDIAREERQETRDARRTALQTMAEAAKNKEKMSSRFTEFVNRSMPKDFSSWTDSDWSNFDRYVKAHRDMLDLEEEKKKKK